MGAILLLRSLAVAVAAMVVNVACAFLWVAIYSMLIAPGQEKAAYEAYAMRAAPWCSVIAGMPILFAAGWLLTRWHGGGWDTGIWAAVAYIVLDVVILAVAAGMAAFTPVVALSAVTKLAAAALGGALAARHLATS